LPERAWSPSFWMIGLEAIRSGPAVLVAAPRLSNEIWLASAKGWSFFVTSAICFAFG
jgi:hypothetical protein